MEVTDKLSFMDLMHVVLSKKLAIPFVSFSKCNIWILCSPVKIFSLCFVIAKNRWATEMSILHFTPN
jgi:hypothetical protein